MKFADLFLKDGEVRDVSGRVVDRTVLLHTNPDLYFTDIIIPVDPDPKGGYNILYKHNGLWSFYDWYPAIDLHGIDGGR